jgi:hypothetical protein
MIEAAESSPPQSLHESASRGDLTAFTALAEVHYNNAASGAQPAEIALAAACVYSRLAGIVGGRDEWLSHMFLLEQHSHVLRQAGLEAMATAAQAEAVAFANCLADEGDEEVEAMLVAAADSLTPEVLGLANDVYRSIGGGSDVWTGVGPEAERGAASAERD